MKNILVLTNDLQNSICIRKQLSSKGFYVAIIAEPKKLNPYIKHSKYELIILDLEDKKALELLVSLRSCGREVPVIVVSNNNSLEFLSEVFLNGADEFVCKPCRLLELEARTIRLLRRTPVTCYEKISIHDLQVDLQNNQVDRAGIQLSLSKKENELLKFMILNKNRLITRDKLLANIWNDKPTIKENTVDCYVSSLRKKLDSVGDHKFLHTEHGMGYVFRV